MTSNVEQHYLSKFCVLLARHGICYNPYNQGLCKKNWDNWRYTYKFANSYRCANWQSVKIKCVVYVKVNQAGK